MRGQVRLTIYVALALALAGVFLAGGEAWARTLARPLGQTVPSPTPVRTYAPTVVVPPTAAPAETPAPNATPAPAATSVPNATPVPPAPGAALALAKTVDQPAIWPGMTATFALTLTNTGSASLRQVTVTDTLPEGLDPGAVLTGPGAAWNGRVLRVTVPVLAPGGVLRVVYTARVRADLAPAAVLVNRAVATAAGGLQAAALVVLGQPPLELPRTGSGGSPGGGLR